ncbi:monovalent cation/H+ antiporter subunit A [Candidimonas nitroreducens]|uniref:Monovalent cation/H+ antiporter subunit A n=1 Tax=Candidimonas nitroreducens TaxID=683354 RepID=A0A225M092_9BURK|nr:monovalent cation/H+ antiporter subunit A [Candidimonas nitroreducens]OWT54748.1 monovalent cation/H+ antiporter subunit A [Candidimonas nitroreducens]
MPLILILALPLAGSLVLAVLPRDARRLQAWLTGLVALACVALLLAQWPEIARGVVVRSVIPWAPELGLDMALRLDGYAWLFALLVTIMGALVTLYARYYLSAQDPTARFFSFFLLFMGSMLGVVLSGNLVQLVVFWEMTSLSSFMLIAFWHHRIDARRGARMAFAVTAAGGLCLLAGVLMLGHVVGSYDLDRVLASGELVRHHPWYPAIVALIALGALSKSAQFPFHFWLPQAMAAPTPVSAYLHSATMVKAGVFLLARLWPVLSGSEQWFWIVGGAGLCSLVLGAYAAMFQQDMKGVLAYSTISHLGLITLLLGMNSPLALVAAVFHMINHATFKASLFMAAGIVDHETGTRDINRLSGLRHSMPLTTVLATVAAASMAGVPLLNGFISKEMFFAETVFINGDWLRLYGLPILAVLAGAFSVAYSLRFILQVFFGPPAHDLPRPPHEPPYWMLLPSALLVLACLVVGMLPARTVETVLEAATGSILGAAEPHYDLAVWHGFNLPLAMSLVAMAGGIALYWLLRPAWRARPGQVPLFPDPGRRIYEATMEALDELARRGLEYGSSPRLQPQLLLALVATIAAAVLPLHHGAWFGPQPTAPVNPWFALLWIAGAACAIGAAVQAKFHRPAALLLTGAAGLVTSLTFVWYSAPDLALTQLAVEVVTVVLILLGLRWLPRRLRSDAAAAAPDAVARRIRDLVVALLAGAGLAALAYAVMTRPAGSNTSAFFLEKALPEGGGTNVVNVILVDFRGFDTLGEITVLGIVALSVYALLRRFRPPPESLEIPAPRRGAADDSPAPDPAAPLPAGPMMVPAVLLRLLLPVAALISLFFLLRGHNLPGGGFVGGLIMATAIILQYMAGGVIWVESRQRIHPQYWMGIGLLLAGGAAVSAWWSLRPLLSAGSWQLSLPLLGTLHVSSVLVFDIGVYMLVIGATILMLLVLAHQSLRLYRQPAGAAGQPQRRSL